MRTATKCPVIERLGRPSSNSNNDRERADGLEFTPTK
jgi:hypothetical protein